MRFLFLEAIADTCLKSKSDAHVRVCQLGIGEKREINFAPLAVKYIINEGSHPEVRAPPPYIVQPADCPEFGTVRPYDTGVR